MTGGFEPIAALPVATTITLPAAWLLGLVYGVGACALACLPFLAPVLVASGDDARTAWRKLLPFSAGRLVGYAALGGISAALGGLLAEQLGGWPNGLIGGAALLLGGYLFWSASKPEAGCAIRHGCAAPTQVPMSGGLFVLGAGMALNPACASLGLILLSAAALGSAGAGIALGLAFGLGATIGPFLIYGVVFAQLSAALHQWLLRWQRALQRGAALLLGLFGLVTAIA